MGLLVSIPVLASMLGAEVYGELVLYIGISALSLNIWITPVLQAIIHVYPEVTAVQLNHRALMHFRDATLKALLRASIALALVIATLIMIGDVTWWLMPLSCLLLVLDSVRTYFLTMMNAGRAQRSAAILAIADTWARLVCAVTAILIISPAAEAVMLGYVVGGILSCSVPLILQVRTDNARGASPQYSDAEPVESLPLRMQVYAKPLKSLGLLGWLSGTSNRYIVGGTIGIAQAGVFSVASGLTQRPFQLLSSMIELTMRPVMQAQIAKGDLDESDRSFRLWLCAVTVLSGLGCLIFAVASDTITTLLLPDTFLAASEVMPYIAAGYFLANVSTVFTRLAYAYDSTQDVLLLNLISAFVAVSACLPLSFFYGLTGASMAVPITFGVEVCLAMYLGLAARRRYRNRLGR